MRSLQQILSESDWPYLVIPTGECKNKNKEEASKAQAPADQPRNWFPSLPCCPD